MRDVYSTVYIYVYHQPKNILYLPFVLETFEHMHKVTAHNIKNGMVSSFIFFSLALAFDVHKTIQFDLKMPVKMMEF